MTTVTKEMAEAANAAIKKEMPPVTSYSNKRRNMVAIEHYVSALEAENAALREQIKALKGGV